MSSQKKYKLGEIYNVTSGLSKPREEFGFGHPFVTFRDVFYNYFLPDELSELANTTEKEIKSCSVKKGDVFLTRTSETMHELGMSSVALKDYPNATFNGFTKRLRLKEDVDVEIDPVYIGYYFRTNEIRNQVDMHATMTTRASLNSTAINSIEISIPDIKHQTPIGKILKQLDDKIELNRRTNHTLEQMAQTLFKKYFVTDIDPDNLPEGWRWAKMGDYIDTISKTHKFPKEQIIFLNTSDILEGKVLINTYSQVESLPGQAKKSIQKNDILFSEIRPGNKRYAYINFDAEDYVVSTKLMVLRSKQSINSLFFYFILTREDMLSHLQNLAEARSGTFPQITFDQIRELDFLLPDEATLNSFIEKTLKPTYELIFKKEKEIVTLSKLRDSLLPKLMSGEITVN